MRGRYAPSPTGYLHLGNARTALLAWLFARAQNSSFILRIEDIDKQRCKPEMIATNIEELSWLGLNWEEGPDIGGDFAPYLQSKREEHYHKALKKLKNHTFACYLSRKDLREIASAPHNSLNNSSLSIYGEAEREYNENTKAERKSLGKLPSLRLDIPNKTMSFCDLFAGKQNINLKKQVGNFVLRRADGMWAYQLAVAVDDMTMNISHVLRGNDLLISTGSQLVLYELLGQVPPKYIHVPLLLDLDGDRMAKRKGSLTLTVLKEQGVKPERVVGFLAYSLGLIVERRELRARELLNNFEITKIYPSSYQLNKDDLNWLLS